MSVEPRSAVTGPAGPAVAAPGPSALRPVRRAGRRAGRTSVAWGTALRRTPMSMWRDDISDYAAALTYYAILAVLPSLLVTVIAFSLISPGTAEDFITHVTAYAPDQSGTQLHDVLSRMLQDDSAAWTLLFGGTVSALWSASSYLAVFRRALHRMHHVPDHRSPWHTAHRILLTAFALLGLLLVSALVLLLTGPLAEAVGHFIGLDVMAAWTWNLLRWPLLMCLVMLLVVIVFHTGPVPARRSRHSLPGGLLAAGLWLTVSAGFALYASALGTYSRLYGSLAGAVVFLIWLWLSNLALLAGAQFTAELNELGKKSAPAGPSTEGPAETP